MAAPVQIDLQALIAEMVNGRQENREAAHRLAEDREINDVIASMSVCDGSEVGDTREWVLHMGMAAAQLAGPLVIRVARRTTKGGLRIDLERFLHEEAVANHNGQQDQIPWVSIRDHVRAAFLCLNEMMSLQTALGKMKRAVMETEVSFSRRYREAADHAYPVANRNPDQQRKMIEGYVQGLSNPAMVRNLVRLHRPATIHEAMNGIAELAEQQEELKNLGIGEEEPMDISATQPNQRPQEGLSDSQTQQVLEMIGKISLGNKPTAKPEVSPPTKSTMEELKDTLQEICAATFNDHQRKSVANKPPRERGQSDRDFWGDGMPAYDTRGRPRCYGCARYGHVRRDCRQRATKPDVGQNQQSGNA